MRKKLLFIGLSENSYMRGVERYVYETIKAIAVESDKIEITLVAGKWQGYYEDLKNKGVTFFYYTGHNKKIMRHLFTIFVVPFIARKYDVVHYGNTMPLLFPLRIPIVMTIHDIADFFVPEKYSRIQLAYRRFVLRYAIPKLSHVITVSNYSKKAIHSFLNVPFEKISVILNGIDHFLNESPACCNLHLPTGYNLLFYSVIERTKGAGFVVDMFERLQRKNRNVHLHLIGNKGNEYEELKERIDTNNGIEYLGYVDDATLQQYLMSVDVVLFPSLYEGFGFPALEAFVYNDNVITSKTTALGEVSKDFATQINPEDGEDFLNAVTYLLENPSVFSEEYKKEIFKSFRWQNAAVETLKIYEEL